MKTLNLEIVELERSGENQAAISLGCGPCSPVVSTPKNGALIGLAKTGSQAVISAVVGSFAKEQTGFVHMYETVNSRTNELRNDRSMPHPQSAERGNGSGDASGGYGGGSGDDNASGGYGGGSGWGGR